MIVIAPLRVMNAANMDAVSALLSDIALIDLAHSNDNIKSMVKISSQIKISI
jgi:hypothetical protein